MYSSISKKMTLAGLLITVLLGVTVASCSVEASQKKPAGEKVPKENTYATTPVKYINPAYELLLPAELKPYEEVAVYAKVTGFVKQLYVDRGDQVHKGQLLAVLEAPEMNQLLRSDKATEQKVYQDYLYAQQAYERMLTAAQTKGAVADIELERAKSRMNSAKSAYQASKAGTAHASQLQQYLRITAPFDGVVMRRNVSIGALAGAAADKPLFLIAQDRRLRLTLSLPEKHAASVNRDMPVTFTVSSQPGKTFNAVLSRTSGLLNQQNRSLTLEFDVDNSAGRLQGGDYAQVTLQLKRQSPTCWVPSESVLHTLSGSYVMTLNDNEISRIAVKEGIRLDTITEVFGALSPEDVILLKPSEEMKTGKL